jgi:hypothetical protein
VGFAAYFARTILLYVRIKQQASAQVLQDTSQNDVYLKFAVWLTPSRLVISIVIASVLMSIPWMVLLTLPENQETLNITLGSPQGPNKPNSPCSALTHTGNSITGLFVILMLMQVGYFIYKTRRNFDNFRIKEELRSVFFSAVILMILEFIESFPGYSNIFYRKDGAFPVHNIAITAGVYMVHMFFVLYQPIYWSFHFNEAIRKSSMPTSAQSSSMRISLSQVKDQVTSVLEDPQGLEALKKFLITEFSVENVLFYTAVQKFRALFAEDSFSKEEIYLSASVIYCRFISSEGVLVINISGQTRDNVRRALLVKPNPEHDEKTVDGLVTPIRIPEEIELEELGRAGSIATINLTNIPDVPKELFDEAWGEVLTLIAKDSFPRFKMKREYSEIWQNLLQSPRSDNALLSERRDDNENE